MAKMQCQDTQEVFEVEEVKTVFSSDSISRTRHMKTINYYLDGVKLISSMGGIFIFELPNGEVRKLKLIEECE